MSEIDENVYLKIIDLVEDFYIQAQDIQPPEYFKPEFDAITATAAERDEHRLDWQRTYAQTNVLNILNIAGEVVDKGVDAETFNDDYDPTQIVNGHQKNISADSCEVMELDKEGYCSNCGIHYEEHKK